MRRESSGAAYLAVWFVCILLFAGVQTPRAETVDRVLAVVNDEVITLTEYLWYVRRTGIDPYEERVDDRLLHRLIGGRVILQEAVRRGAAVDEREVQKGLDDFVASQGIDLNEFERRLALEKVTLKEYRQLLKESIMTMKFVDSEVTSKLIVTEKEIGDHYRENRRRFLQTPEKVTVKAIYLRLSANPSPTEITDLKLRSLRIHSRLLKGEQFEKLVGEFSDEPLRQQEGYFGEFEKGALISPLGERIAQMKEDEISEPVWTRDGVYILKLVSRRPETYQPLQEVRKQIYDAIFEKKRDDAFNEWMRGLWSKAHIKIMQ